MKKRCTFLMLVIVALFLFPEKSGARSVIQLNHEAGFDSLVKEGKSYPLRFHVTNTGTEAFSGDLVIQFSSSYDSRGARVVSIQLDAGETKEYAVIMPAAGDFGHHYGPEDEQISLYRGSWKTGEKVAFSGKKEVVMRFIPADSVTAGILSEHPDRISPLKGAVDGNIQWHNLEAADLPENPRGLEYFDYLIVDGFPLASLTAEQQEALLYWLKAGGTMIVGAAENPGQTYGVFLQELPLAAEGRTALADVKLADEVHISSLQVMTGSLREGEAVVQDGEVPLVVKKDANSGEIIQMAFSIGSEPVVSVRGYPEWFTSFLGAKNRITRYNTGDFYNSLYWDYARYNEFFGGLNLSIGQLTGILVLYLFLVVPVLYLVLKRMDKREHAWWLIPTFAVICSAFIFFSGGKDRLGRAGMNEMGIFVSENNFLHGFHVLSLQSHRGGDYIVTARENEFLPVPMAAQNISPGDRRELPHFQEDRQNLEIIFPDMEYWSVRTLIGEAQKHVEGSFSRDLSLVDGRLTGTITNEFPYDFVDVFIWAGKEKHPLGALRQGETVRVDLLIGRNFLHTPRVSEMDAAVDGGGDRDVVAREQLLNSAVHQYAFNHSAPVIAGITRDEIITTDLSEQEVEKQQVSLILVPFYPDIALNGEVTLFNDDFHIEFRSLSGTFYEKYFPAPDVMEIYGDPGLYEFIYKLPAGLDRARLHVSEITIFHPGNDLYSVFRASEKTFVQIGPEQRVVISEGADEYLTENGEIIIQVEKQAHNERTLSAPDIRLKGSVADHD